MVDQDWPFLLERGTALAWFLLAVAGIALRLRRLRRLHQIILRKPEEQEDIDYLRSVVWSTYLRLGVKVALLVGSIVALFHLMDIVLLWRFSVIVALILMTVETHNVDAVRARLARNATSRRRLGERTQPGREPTT